MKKNYSELPLYLNHLILNSNPILELLSLLHASLFAEEHFLLEKSLPVSMFKSSQEFSWHNFLSSLHFLSKYLLPESLVFILSSPL